MQEGPSKPLSEIERRLLQLDWFQHVEKNQKVFSNPENLAQYPINTLDGLVEFYVKERDISRQELRSVGLILDD